MDCFMSWRDAYLSSLVGTAAYQSIPPEEVVARAQKIADLSASVFEKRHNEMLPEPPPRPEPTRTPVSGMMSDLPRAG